MNVFKVSSIPLLHFILQKAFQYSLEGEYLALSSSNDYATIPSEHDVLAIVFSKEHRWHLHTALYPTEKITWWLNALFVSNAEQIKSNCNYEVKPQLYNVTYNLKKNLWAVGTLSTVKFKLDACRRCTASPTKSHFNYCICPMKAKLMIGTFISPLL